MFVHFWCGCGGDSHRGEFLKTGLWSISRHPNYWGEMCIWWGIWLAAAWPFILDASDGNWAGLFLILTLLSPLFTTFLMVFGSGTLISERKFDADYRASQYDEWHNYLQGTSPMTPCFGYKFLPHPLKVLLCCEFPFYRDSGDAGSIGNRFSSSGDTNA